MYSVLIGALLIFPWMFAIHIAFGAFRASRRSAIPRKQVEQITNRS
ncbi:MAG: hypothetical protein HW409_208 [candidate division NC10 bacterium]|jgi:hypothetical protein|nr:hypothetical protein [candidate division NC10 bacterium]